MTFTKYKYRKDELTELLSGQKTGKVDPQKLYWIVAYQEKRSLKGKTEQEVDNQAMNELEILG